MILRHDFMTLLIVSDPIIFTLLLLRTVRHDFMTLLIVSDPIIYHYFPDKKTGSRRSPFQLRHSNRANPALNQKLCIMPMPKREGSAPPLIAVPPPETRSVEPTPVPRPYTALLSLLTRAYRA